jgi:SAM-dependent methyltransferase
MKGDSRVHVKNRIRYAARLAGMALGLATVVTAASAQTPSPSSEPFKPTVGQAGKDVVWVPTPAALVEKMLDMAKVTPQDIVMDLGSGDGRNIIAAAKRGATAIGVEYNPDMVAVSRQEAEKQGVADKATFIQGDMYEADISKATVLALFLLPHNLNKLTPKFLALKPGTRIVGNTFAPEGWEADETETITGDCVSWCTSLLWIVPARAEGTWKLPQGELSLKQEFQMVSGTLTANGTPVPVSGRLRGDLITFTAGSTEYAGRVSGDAMEGNVTSTAANGGGNGNGSGSRWSAKRIN